MKVPYRKNRSRVVSLGLTLVIAAVLAAPLLILGEIAPSSAKAGEAFDEVALELERHWPASIVANLDAANFEVTRLEDAGYHVSGVSYDERGLPNGSVDTYVRPSANGWRVDQFVTELYECN